MSLPKKLIVPISILLLIIFVILSINNQMLVLISGISILAFIVGMYFKIDITKIALLFCITILISFNMLRHNLGIVTVGGIILILIILFLIDKKYRTKTNIKDIYFFFFIWITYAGIQLFYIQKNTETWEFFQALLIGSAIILIITRLVDNKESLKILYNVWGISILLTIIVGWWEIFTGNHLPTSRAHIDNIDHTVATAGFFNQNDYSFYLILSLPIILYWIKKDFIFKVLGLFMLISSFYFSYLNGTRFVLLIFLLALFVYVVQLTKDNKKLFFFFIAAIIISIFYFREVIIESITEIVTLVDSSDNSVNERKWLTESAWEIFKEHPFGVGSGNLSLYMPIKGYNVHNFWLEILVNYGFIIFLLLVIYFLSVLIIILKSKVELKNYLIPIIWTTIIFIPTCIVSSTIFRFNITWFVLAIMACAINIIRLEYKNKTRELV